MIPILDLTEQYAAIKEPIDAAIAGVLAGGHFINGPEVKAFERDLAEFVGVRHAIGLNSGTDALHLALRAYDIGPGDEVITTPFTFIATTEAIGIVGATPVFVDVDPRTLNLDVGAVEAAITPRTKAILPVHLYGNPADMDALLALAKRHGLRLIEDCAQAIGARFGDRNVGAMGDAGCFSFFPSKNLGGYGDGGMLTTDSDELAARVRALRGHGGRVKYYHDELGVNSRLDEMQAAILRVKLRHLNDWNAARRGVAERYRTMLAHCPGIELLTETVGGTPVYHQFTLLVDDRDRVHDVLAASGVQSMIYYPVPLHLQRVHADLPYAVGSFPVSEDAAARVLSLPMFPELRMADQRVVCKELLAAVSVRAAA